MLCNPNLLVIVLYFLLLPNAMLCNSLSIASFSLLKLEMDT